MRRAVAVAVRVAAVAAMALSAWLLVTVWRHGTEPVHDLPRWATTVGMAAAQAAFIGSAAIVWNGQPAALAVAVLGALILASIVVIPVLGMLLLVGGLVWMARSRQGALDRRALGAGLVVAVGVPVAALVAADGPLVECHENGVSSSSSIFRPSGSGSGSGSSEGDGELTSGGRHFTYRCDGDRLLHFSRQDRAAP